MEVLIKMFDGYTATIRSMKALKNHPDINKDMEIVEVRSATDKQIDHINKFIDRFKKNECSFKDTFLFDSMSELKDDIDYHKHKFKSIQSKDSRLFDMGDERLLIMVDSAREDVWYFNGRYPSLKEIKECYKYASSNYPNFEIIYDCIIREWDSFQDRFKGERSYFSAEYITITLIKKQ